MKVQLVGMTIGRPNAHDTRYYSDLVVPSSRRYIPSSEFLFDPTVKPLDGSIITVEVSIRLVLLSLFFLLKMIVSITTGIRRSYS